MIKQLLRLGAVAVVAGVAGCRSADQVGPTAEHADPQAEAARLLRSSPHRDPIPVFIDGRRFVKTDEAEGFSIIDPDRIATIQLFTGSAGEARAGAAGRAGVIWITTKDAAPAR